MCCLHQVYLQGLFCLFSVSLSFGIKRTVFLNLPSTLFLVVLVVLNTLIDCDRHLGYNRQSMNETIFILRKSILQQLQFGIKKVLCLTRMSARNKGKAKMNFKWISMKMLAGNLFYKTSNMYNYIWVFRGNFFRVW